jgi:hypothetical protein
LEKGYPLTTAAQKYDFYDPMRESNIDALYHLCDRLQESEFSFRPDDDYPLLRDTLPILLEQFTHPDPALAPPDRKLISISDLHRRTVEREGDLFQDEMDDSFQDGRAIRLVMALSLWSEVLNSTRLPPHKQPKRKFRKIPEKLEMIRSLRRAF